jgi:hypothetical protein
MLDFFVGTPYNYNCGHEKWGEKMPSKKLGRPVSDNHKDKTLKIRMDKQTTEMLDECSQELKINRSEVVRKGIKKIHDDLKK